MAYSAEVIRRARARLAEARADRESENNEHLRVAYEKVPRLKQIDEQLRRSMALAARAAFSSGEAPGEAMEQVRLSRQALQQERERLVAFYFEEGYLDDSPICEHCSGLGYVGSAMCECLRELCRQEQKKELALLTSGMESFDKFRLDYYSDRVDGNYGVSPRALMSRNFDVCRRFAQQFGSHTGNLLFVGGTGLGKTFLSACIARAVAEKGHYVVYESAPHLFSKLEMDRFNGSEETAKEIRKFTECELLIVDDLGTELPGNFVTAALYTLVNDRLLAEKPTVISTNLTIDEIAERYSPQIASRLRGGYQGLTFVGEDIRVIKSRGF